VQVLQLERQLKDQFVVRRVLEKALSHRPLSHDAATGHLIPKVTSLCQMGTSCGAYYII
jgi:hypothetical protein